MLEEIREFNGFDKPLSIKIIKVLKQEGWDAYHLNLDCSYEQGSQQEKYWFEGYNWAGEAEAFAQMDRD